MGIGEIFPGKKQKSITVFLIAERRTTLVDADHGGVSGHVQAVEAESVAALCHNLGHGAVSWGSWRVPRRAVPNVAIAGVAATRTRSRCFMRSPLLLCLRVYSARGTSQRLRLVRPVGETVISTGRIKSDEWHEEESGGAGFVAGGCGNDGGVFGRGRPGLCGPEGLVRVRGRVLQRTSLFVCSGAVGALLQFACVAGVCAAMDLFGRGRISGSGTVRGLFGGSAGHGGGGRE
jgi:hypothetical protein